MSFLSQMSSERLKRTVKAIRNLCTLRMFFGGEATKLCDTVAGITRTHTNPLFTLLCTHFRPAPVLDEKLNRNSKKALISYLTRFK